MRVNRAIFAIFVLSICNIQCGKGSKTAIKEKTVQKNVNDAMPISTNNIAHLSYEEAIDSYGEPSSTEEFENNAGDRFPGIRAGIRKYYPSGVKATIKEAVWNKDDSTKIAVWYTKKQDRWMPFDHFEYGKNTDF